MKRLLLFLLLPLFTTFAACKTTSPACPPQTPGGYADDKTEVAKFGTRSITLAEVDKAAGSELFELRKNTLNRLLINRIVEPLAKAENTSVDGYLAKKAEERVPQVTEEEAQKFFAENQSRLPPQLASKPFAEVKDMIITGLTRQKRNEATGTIIEELKTKAGVQILLPVPPPTRVEVSAEGPSKGPKDAKVTIVEFSDFQCPYCSKGRATIDEVVKAYGDKVRVVFRDFPLDFHEHAEKAAEASHCADEQGKFWAMHDWMFDHQDKLDVDHLKEAAKGLGLDSTQFDSCLSSGKYAKLVTDNLHAGSEAGVQGTPAFFINGIFISGARPFEDFKKEIDRELGN